MDSRQKYININPSKFNMIPLAYFYKFREEAIERDYFMGSPGFKYDYLVLHGIIKEINPETFCEIGTHTGEGTNVICNAMPGKRVLSIDLPVDYDEKKEIYKDWASEKPESGVGSKCTFPFTQLFGNSKDFDFSKHYPIDGWFIDGRHNYEFCYSDTINALKSDPKVIIWHDTLMDGVQKAIMQIIDEQKNNYKPYYASGTRMSWIVKK